MADTFQSTCPESRYQGPHCFQPHMQRHDGTTTASQQLVNENVGLEVHASFSSHVVDEGGVRHKLTGCLTTVLKALQCS